MLLNLGLTPQALCLRPLSRAGKGFLLWLRLRAALCLRGDKTAETISPLRHGEHGEPGWDVKLGTDRTY
jgi:hypothetical protein